MRLSTIHHRDIATAMHLALAGQLDNRTVNITYEAPPLFTSWRNELASRFSVFGRTAGQPVVLA